MALTRPRYSNIVDTDYKASVRFITTTNITLAGSAPDTYDGLSLVVGDRILVNAQSTGSQNGIYIVQTVGTGSNGTWIRSFDASTSDRVTAGMRTFIAEGTYAGSEYRLVTPDPIVIDSTTLSFQSTAATVSGTNKAVQYNDAGFIAGAAFLTYDNVTGNVVIAANTATVDDITGALVVKGGVGIVGSLFANAAATFNTDVTIRGNLYAQGNTYITTSTDLAIQDSIINLHTFANLAPLTVNDGKDIGLKFHYYEGSQDNHAFVGRVNTTGYLEWLSAGTETSGNVFTGTAYGTFKTGNILLVANTYRGSSTISSATQTYINAFTTKSATPPASPQPGDKWYDTDTDVIYEWFTDGTSSYWIDTLGKPAGVNWFSQSTQPAGAKTGDYWYDTTTDIVYTFVYDGSAYYWVDYSSIPSSIPGTGALLANVSVGDILSEDIFANSVSVGNTYGNISVNNTQGQFVLGTDTRNAAARYITNTTTSVYSGMSIQRAGSELFFAGVDNQENYVIRQAGTTNVVSVSANNTVSLTGNINSLGSGLFQGPYDENSIISGVFVGNAGTAPGITPRIGFFNGNTQQNWQIDNNAGEFRWFVPGLNRLSLYPNGNLNVTGSLTVGGKKAVNGPAFSAYADSTGQTITSGSQQKVLFQTEEFDTDNCYTNSRFTPTVEGYYQLNAEVRLDGATGTGEMMIVIWKNGAEYKRGTNQSGTQIASNFWAMTVSSLVYANGTTDYFEIYVQQGSGSSVTVTAVNSTNLTWFNGAMVRGA